MVETTKKFIEEVDELTKECLKKVLNLDDIMDMKSDELSLIVKMFKVMDTSKKVMLKQAEIMDEQNRKLDLLLKQTKTNKD